MTNSFDEARRKNKIITYARMYGASEITVGRHTGEYPVMLPDFSALELRVLALTNPKSPV